MKFNVHIDTMVHVTVRGRQYPVTVSGSGIPCLSIMQGTLGQRTLSPQFKKMFKVYASDLYFDERYALKDRTSLTMNQIVDDIAECAQQFNLSKFVLFGFSAGGIIALEFAKKYPDMVAGIIMVGTPPNSNQQIAARNNAYFEAHAEPERKKIDAERRAVLAQEDLSSLSYSDRFLRRYTFGAAPRNWYQPDFDCSGLWQGMLVDPILDHLFGTIFPQTDVMKHLETVTCPVFLAAGLNDYNCCPWMWNEIKNLPPHMVISEFKKSGHYPQYEEQELFDERVEAWAQENFRHMGYGK